MDVDLAQMPHWVRVAFAARCARRVQPLFAQAWPDASPNRVAAVEQAIALAEKSAAEQRACDGLKDATLGAVMAAGRALIPHHHAVPINDNEAAPTGSDSSLVASFAAKVAEKAAEAAAADPHESAQPAQEAFHLAIDAINAARHPGLTEVLEADFESMAGKRWWRFW